MDFDPVKAARDERKGRVAKNEKQRLGNIARAAPRERDVRKKEIDTTLATTRISTASMGKFDKKLEGEKKMRGIKRKVCPSYTFSFILTHANTRGPVRTHREQRDAKFFGDYVEARWRDETHEEGGGSGW